MGIVKHLPTFSQTFPLHIELKSNHCITLYGHFCKLETKYIGAKEQTISTLKFDVKATWLKCRICSSYIPKISLGFTNTVLSVLS